MTVNLQDVNAGEENPDTRFGEESCFTWIFLSSCSRSSWSSKQGNRVIIYAVPMQYIGTRRSLMSLIIFIEISIFSRGCYEHATPPYSTESPESRDKCSGVGAVWASKYACRVQDQSQCARPVHIYFVCIQRMDGLRSGFDKPCHSVIFILCHNSCDDFCQSFNDMVISLWYHQNHGARASIEGGFFESNGPAVGVRNTPRLRGDVIGEFCRFSENELELMKELCM